MKKIKLLAIALLCVCQSFAQETPNADNDQAVVSSFASNWSVSVGAGVEFYPHFTSIDNPNLDIPAGFKFDVSVGKWLCPYVGLRIKYSYATLNVNSTSSMNRYIADGETSTTGSISYLNGDAMFDLTAIFGGYKQDRLYSIKPYVGMSFMFVRSSSGAGDNEYLPAAGILNEFRISDSFSVQLDLSVTPPNASVYGESSANPRFLNTSLTAGLTYYFGFSKEKDKSRAFKTVATSEKFQAITTNNDALLQTISDLKSANSSLARENESLKNELSELKARKPQVVVKTQVKVAPLSLFFAINNSVLTKENVARLKYVADILKQHPDVKYVLDGYADAATGSKEYNQALSQRRADAVRKVLVEKYGVDASQIEAVGNGAVSDLFDSISLNRAVVIRIKE